MSFKQLIRLLQIFKLCVYELSAVMLDIYSRLKCLVSIFPKIDSAGSIHFQLFSFEQHNDEKLKFY